MDRDRATGRAGVIDRSRAGLAATLSIRTSGIPQRQSGEHVANVLLRRIDCGVRKRVGPRISPVVAKRRGRFGKKSMPHSETTCQAAATRTLLGALTGFVAVWGLVLAASWSSLTAYGFKRDVPDDAPTANWPADSQIARRADRSLLLVFLHPMCPCSHATISELERILRTQDHGADRGPDVAIVACTPWPVTESWTRTSLVQRAAQLPCGSFSQFR